MAKFLPKIDFQDTEYNALEASRRFTPPFYINTVQGKIGERMSYPAGQVYVILRKIKVKSVIATVGGVSLKIPLDYKGTFSIIGQNINPLNMTEIMELSDIETYIVEVRLSDLEQHGKHFLDTIDSIGRGIRTCNFKFIEETTDEYFIGRSPDGSLVMIFSTEANMTFQVKETSVEDMQHLLFHVKDLKYDVFVTHASFPAIKFFTTKEVFNFPPPRPPKPKPSGRSDLTMSMLTGTPKPKPPAKPEEPSTESHSSEKLVINPRKQSSRQPDKEFAHSFHQGAGAGDKEDDNDAGSELVDDQVQHMPDDIRKRYENFKRMFSIRKQLNNPFKKKISKLNKTKKQLSGDMADDELTEDPYAEQKQDAQRKTFRKRPTRNRNEPHPSPTSLTISSPIHSPGASPRSSPLPKLPYDSPHQSGDTDSGFDYEKIDDDVDVVNIPRRPPMSAPIKLHGAEPRLQSHPLPTLPPKSLLRGYPQPLPVIPPNQGIKSDIGPPVKDQSCAVTLPDKLADEMSKQSNRPDNVAVVRSSSRPDNVAVVQPTQSQYQFPTYLSNLGIEAIAKALQHLKIPEETIDTFREAQIDGQTFVCLDDAILDELDVNSFHKLKIIRFKNGWRPTGGQVNGGQV